MHSKVIRQLCATERWPQTTRALTINNELWGFRETLKRQVNGSQYNRDQWSQPFDATFQSFAMSLACKCTRPELPCWNPPPRAGFERLRPQPLRRPRRRLTRSRLQRLRLRTECSHRPSAPQSRHFGRPSQPPPFRAARRLCSQTSSLQIGRP